MERRKIAESEDFHFRGRVPATSLLGHAMNKMGTPSSNSYSSKDDDEEDNNNSNSFTYESLTPTFGTSRKRPSEGHRMMMPLQATSNNSHLPPSRNSVTSTASTRVIDNRGGGHHNDMMSGNYNSISALSSQDPLSLSTRSLQSDDVPPIVAESMDTVHTSNVALYQQYQNNHGYHNNNNHGMMMSSNHHHNRFNNSRHPNPTIKTQQHILSVSPPSNLRFHYPSPINEATAPNTTGDRRSVFGNQVQKKYPPYGGQQTKPFQVFAHPPPPDPAPFYNIIDQGEQTLFQQAEQQPPHWEILPSSSSPTIKPIMIRNSFVAKQQQTTPWSSEPESSMATPLSLVVTASTATSSTDSSAAQEQDCTTIHNNNNENNPIRSPPPSPTSSQRMPRQSLLDDDLVSPLQSPSFSSPLHHHHRSTNERSLNHRNSDGTSKSRKGTHRRKSSRESDHSSGNKNNNNPSNNCNGKSVSIHETVHAQSLLLGLCFMAIWSPNNIMAPNLTQIATFYHMTVKERDLYLGSFLALATGVLSLPVSAVIGFLTDLYSRKVLFVATAFGGAIASAATGLSPTYPCLLLSRFFSGGFMGASTSVAFSLMGDLFATEERNAASSGLTAMMGLGIILGQVYAGVIGDEKGWQHAFYVSSIVTALLGLCVALLVQEPVRGGKEKALQDLLKQGKQYDRKLTWHGFMDVMSNNRSNRIIVAQGFFSNVPWGIIFVFLNDYLSQERGFSVPDATFIVLVFGIGCAVGGILGGSAGALVVAVRGRSYLPLFMAATTVLGIFPYLALLNGHTHNAHGYLAILYSFMAGCISNLPSVNVRPCLINVNPPETRGASLTAANLIINFARGIGPSCITLLGSTFRISRQASFNATLATFWIISAVQLCFLAQSLPHDQDKMEADLEHYAASALAMVSPEPTALGDQPDVHSAVKFAMESGRPQSTRSQDEVSLVSIEDRWTSFDDKAARESISFLKKGMEELHLGNFCSSHIRGSLAEVASEDSSDDDYDYEEQHRNYTTNTSTVQGDDHMSPVDILKRRDLWKQHQQQLYGSGGVTGQRADHDDDQHLEGVVNSEDMPATETTRLL
jgi:MFS family permease